ncbi:MAG: hypothetical protein ABDH66_02985 [Bacteroidia bacterium]
MKKAFGLLLLWSCQPTEHNIPQWYAIEIAAETFPILAHTLEPANDSIRVVRLVLRRDPLTDKPEWLSGHRHALAFYLEQLPIRVIVIEPPWDDTAFFRAGQAWMGLFQQWLSEEFLPFIRPYTSVEYVVFRDAAGTLPLGIQPHGGICSSLLRRLTLLVDGASVLDGRIAFPPRRYGIFWR